VLGRNARLANLLRTCPICGSPAVSAVRPEGADGGASRCLVRCGQCETWRGLALEEHWEAWSLERRISRSLARERRRLARLEVPPVSALRSVAD
jgi:hypothetical protein